MSLGMIRDRCTVAVWMVHDTCMGPGIWLVNASNEFYSHSVEAMVPPKRSGPPSPDYAAKPVGRHTATPTWSAARPAPCTVEIET